MAAITTTILAALAVGSAAKSVYDATHTPTQPTLPQAPSASVDAIQAAQSAAAARARTQKRAAGAASRSGTLLTGPMGITTPAPTVRKSLLGE